MKIKMKYLVEAYIYSWLLYVYHAKLTPGLVETNCTDVTKCSGFGNNREKWDPNEVLLYQFPVKYFMFKLRVKNFHK